MSNRILMILLGLMYRVTKMMVNGILVYIEMIFHSLQRDLHVSSLTLRHFRFYACIYIFLNI